MRTISATHRIDVPAGGHVTATVTAPDNGPTRLVTLHPATATPRRFYTAAAELLAARGAVVVTYDLRGTGDSGHAADHPHLAMRHWMLEDVPAVAHWARTEYGELPHHAVGHSIGGHALVLGQGGDDLTSATTVASHVAHTPTVRGLPERLKVAALLHVLGPGLSRVLGYAPGRRLGVGEDIPAAAMVEWGRWARRRRYFFDDPTLDADARAAAVRTPLLAIGASDDPWGTPPQVDALTSHLTAAPVERRTYAPDELGVSSIGHHGLLRRGVVDRWADDLLTWFRHHETAPRPGNRP